MRAGRRSLVGAVGAVALTAGFLGAAPPAFAAGSIALGSLDTPYVQDFDTLAATGTANTALPDGWYISEVGSSAAADGNYAAGTGSGNGGNVYSFGAKASNERALGSLRSGTLAPSFGGQLTNSTGATITSADVAYTGEQWRLGTSGREADRLDLQVSTDATSLTTGTWTNVDALDFSSPVTVGTPGALDGNAAANRTAVSGSVSGLTVAAGSTVWVRWTDVDATSADDGLAVDDFSLTPHGTAGPVDQPPTVVSTTPVDGATGVALGSDITATFSEAVTTADGAFTLACGGSSRAVTVSGTGDTRTIDPTTDFADGDSCTLTVHAAGVADTDGTPDQMVADYSTSFTAGNACAAPYTHAYEIQGTNDTPAMTGAVTTQGVVVGDYEGASPALRGFYLQDVAGDGDPETSDAVFVFEGSNTNSVAVGDVVRVSGNAGDNQGQTQISLGSGPAPEACGTGSVSPTDVTLPFASADFPERYEGMLVRMPQELSVTEHFQLGRFGQVLMSSGGRLQQPTSVVAPGAPAQQLQAANDLNQILFDDASQAQNPDPIVFGRGGQPLSATNTLRGGDTATGSVGVMTYTWGGNSASPNAFRVRPYGSLGGSVDFEPANPRPGGAPARAAGTDVRVAGMNLLNFFNTYSGCTFGAGGPTADCRGADDQAEFDRQWPKTVEGIVGTGADVVGINEIENDGYGPDSAIAFLVNKLNARTATGTYAFVNVDAGTGQTNAAGTDAIKVGVLYKPAVVTPVGTTAALNSDAFVNGGDSAPRSRPSVAQAFEENATGARFVVDVNHLKSKGSACTVPDAGDGSGNCNAARTRAAEELAAWLDGDPTGSGDSDVVLVGDYNSYAMETPVTTLEDAGYTNLIRDRIGADAYSYVFDGQWGYLDYAFGSESLLSQVAGVYEWHINADEPAVLDYNTNFKTAGQVDSLYAPDEFRISDHDPVIVDLALTPPAESSTTTLTVTPQSQVYGTQTPATWTAAVVLSHGGSPAGTVELLDGDIVIGTATVSGGEATGTLPAFLPAGSHTLTARFVPADTDDATGSTSAATSFAVTQAHSITGLSVRSAKVKTKGGPADFVLDMTAPVTLETGRPAAGTVSFTVDGVQVAQATVVNGSARGVASTSKGTHDVRATFTPSDTDNVVGSSSPVVRVRVK